MTLKIFIYLSILAVLIMVMIFGFSFFPAFFLSLKDSACKAFARKRGDIPVFNMYGVHIFSGRVGCGKTISMVRRARHIKRIYPNIKIYANFTTDVADGYITSWEDIVKIENIDENGINQGVLFLFDEIHLTFDSQGWRNAPDNLLEYISLQRHLHGSTPEKHQKCTCVNGVVN